MDVLLRHEDNTTSNDSASSDTYSNIHIFYWEKIFTAIIISFISVSGLVGNAMIITAVAFCRKLQTSTNAFVVNLSIVDFLTSFFLIWYILGLLGDNRWPLPKAKWICTLTAFMLFECTCAGLYTMAAIAINRLIRITKPDMYQNIFAPPKLIIFIAITWIIPLVSISAVLGTKNVAFGYDKSDGTCSDLDTHEKADLANMVQTVVALPIPFTIIITSYTLIFVHLKIHFKKTKQLCSSPAASNSSTIPEESKTNNTVDMSVGATDDEAKIENQNDSSFTVAVRRKQRVSRQQIEITKNLFLVVFVYFFCLTPFLIAISIPFSLSGHVIFYLRIPFLASSAVNIAIYARKHPYFKPVLKHLLTCSYDRIPQPSKLLKVLLRKKL